MTTSSPSQRTPLACQGLRAQGYNHDSFEEAKRALKLGKGEIHRGKRLAEVGPCPKLGYHWTFPRRGGRVDSITSCPCVDGPNRPERNVYRIH